MIRRPVVRDSRIRDVDSLTGNLGFHGYGHYGGCLGCFVFFLNFQK